VKQFLRKIFKRELFTKTASAPLHCCPMKLHSDFSDYFRRIEGGEGAKINWQVRVSSESITARSSKRDGVADKTVIRIKSACKIRLFRNIEKKTDNVNLHARKNQIRHLLRLRH